MTPLQITTPQNGKWELKKACISAEITRLYKRNRLGPFSSADFISVHCIDGQHSGALPDGSRWWRAGSLIEIDQYDGDEVTLTVDVHDKPDLCVQLFEACQESPGEISLLFSLGDKLVGVDALYLSGSGIKMLVTDRGVMTLTLTKRTGPHSKRAFYYPGDGNA